MKKPDQESINSWLDSAKESIDRDKKDFNNGWYEQENLPLQSYFVGMSHLYSDLGCARLLSEHPMADVCNAFSLSGKNMLQVFTMAYDPNDLLYVGDKPKREDQIGAGYGQVNWANVREIDAIDGLNWALMGKDFETARQLAFWYQDAPDGYKMEPVVNHYIYSYKYILLDRNDDAAALLKTTIEHYQAKPPKHIGHKNYYYLSHIMQGIALGDSSQVNEALLQYLAFYKKSVIPAEDYWDTPEEFICDRAVALVNLAIFKGIIITAKHDLMPQGLIS